VGMCVGRVNGPAQGREVHKRMRWTPEDEAALRAAVAACHKGNWTRIRLHNPALEKFTTGQLKVGMCLRKTLCAEHQRNSLGGTVCAWN
jgi:hypothetical protein